MAFILPERLQGIDLERVPLPVAPDLVIEIVSKNDRADDLLLKVNQYLAAGAQAVTAFLSQRAPRLPLPSWQARS